MSHLASMLQVPQEALATTNSGGQRVNLREGQAITYTNLPNQLVALVVYNNGGNNTEISVSYNASAPPKKFTLESVQSAGNSLGLVYLVNPSVTNITQISLSIPDFKGNEGDIDVYCMSLRFPLGGGEYPIQNMEMSTRPTPFGGYSRAYATPQLQWYSLMVQSSEEGSKQGLIGLYFNASGNIEFWGFGVNTEAVYGYLNSKERVYYDETFTGVSASNVVIDKKNLTSANRLENSIYGMSQQIVFSPISAAKFTDVGQISLTPQ